VCVAVSRSQFLFPLFHRVGDKVDWYLRFSVNVFFQLNQENPDPDLNHDVERMKQEKEFKIGSVGFADSSGILLASMLAVPTEIELCRAQIRRGKLLCKGL